MLIRFTLLLFASLVFAQLQAQNPQLTLMPFATGLSQPIDLTHANDNSGRIFVNEKTGAIKILNATGTVTGTFLDISAKVSTSGERGLLGLAFAPDYATSGRFYVDYTNTIGNTVIARYQVSTADPNVANAGSEEILLTITQPFSNHNGGDIAFGPDGLLYIASGDGGSGNDPQANAENLNSFLGKILRLNVSGTTGYIAAGGYPLAAPEVFAVGLRNPWRMSFDSQTGQLYIGDVGQGAREEIDLATTSSVGLNYGWVCWEGSLDNSATASAAQSNCQPYSSYAAPIFEYDHSLGQSLTGGLVYRGQQYPALQGFYVFADYSTDRMWAIRGVGASQEVYVYSSIGNKFVGFGQDQNGEAYVVSIFGSISRLSSSAPLPVALTAFTASRDEDCNLQVAWSAASEQNFSHYELELSQNSDDWKSMSKIEAGKKEYTLTIPRDYSAPYVRLKLHDLDGSIETSETVFAEDICNKPSFFIYPTQLNRGEMLSVDTDNANVIFLYDALGREVGKMYVSKSIRSSFDTSGLISGIYTLRNGAMIRRFVIH